MTVRPHELPPLRVKRTNSGMYLYTYEFKWIPAIKNIKGKVIKKGYTHIFNKTNVGKLISNGQTNIADFYDEFLDENPELREYVAFRKPDNSWEFKLKTELDSSNPDDKLALDLINSRYNYESNVDGRVYIRAEDTKREPAEDNQDSSNTCRAGGASHKKLDRRTRKHSGYPLQDFTPERMEEVVHSIGLREDLHNSFKYGIKRSKKKFSDKELFILTKDVETLVMTMALSDTSWH